MSEDKSFSLNALTRHYSIQEITAIFSDIDERIMSMHDSSSKDFQMFNQQLRDFNEIANKISENLQAVSEITSDHSARDDLQEFSGHYEQLLDNITTMHTALQEIKNNGENTISYLQKIPLILKNFNQDLMTLKFTLANIKVNFSEYFEGKADNVSTLSGDVENLVQTIKEDLPGLFKSARATNNLLEELTGSILENSFDRIFKADNVIRQINENIRELINKNEQIGKALPEIHAHVQKSFTNLDKIVTKIQYHDIIKQKMEHIQATHKQLIKELSNLDQAKENQIVLFRQAKYASQIPYIAEIQIAQLIYTNKEYQNALEAITHTFDDIKKHMSFSADMTHKLRQSEIHSLDNNYENVKKELNQTTETIYQLKKNYLDIIRIADFIKQHLDELKGHIKKLKELESKLRELSKNLSAEIYERLSDKNLAKVGLEVQNLVSDLSSNISNCELYLNYACRFKDDITTKLDLIKNREDITLAQELCSSADKVLENVSGKKTDIHKRLDENEHLSKSAHEKLRNTFEEIHYYDFFEGSMEAVIFELNNIYENLQSEHPDLSNMDKQEKLKRIKTFYTTKTEHDIHDGVISGKDSEQSDEKDSGDEDEDNIEFF